MRMQFLLPVKYRLTYGVILAFVLSSCAGLKNNPKNQLINGVYWYRSENSHYRKARVFVQEDSIIVTRYDKQADILNSNSSARQIFLKRTFDVDVISVPFRLRPSTLNVPRQLTTDFNGNVYIGYRLDRFALSRTVTPFGRNHRFTHHGITAGVFGGLASSSITPTTTNNIISDEYDGFVLTRGVAFMIGLNSLTVGIGIGWDYLTDRDKDVWVYQNKPWYGLTVGLNLN